MSPEIKSVVIGTAGHIDHGKTTLVKALTGIDTDRLPEEKRRGITVDLGFASFETSTIDGRPLRLSFVDVPGHHLFIHNMLAGAGGIDCALLVISAEEGVKPQTVEHLQILQLLGISAGMTVLTKCDAVGRDRVEEVSAAIARWLGGQFLPIVPVSAKTGEGLPELILRLGQFASQIPARAEHGLLHLPVDRSFVMKGFGTVVTGSLQSGSISRGQQVLIEPGSRKARVRGVQNHGREAERVLAGSRVAVNLSNIEASEVRRGHALVEPQTYAPVTEVDAEVELLPHSPGLKHRAPVHLYAFASAVKATVLLYGRQAIGPGERALARLKLDEPVVITNRSRFVLRQWSPLLTIGGGIVLDAYPARRLKRSQRLEWLAQLRSVSRGEELRLRAAQSAGGAATVNRLMIETGASRETIEALLVRAMPVEAPVPKAQTAPTSLEQQRLAKIAKIYRETGFLSPSPEEVAQPLKIPAAEMRTLMTLLLRDKTLVKIGLEEFYVHREALEALTRELKKKQGREIGVPEFKDVTGLTRKRAVPLLEHLDRLRVTLRKGDARLIL